MDNGNKITIISATCQTPKALAHAAFNKINAMTPAFTALPMFEPTGFCMAFNKGLKIMNAKKARKARESGRLLFAKAK